VVKSAVIKRVLEEPNQREDEAAGVIIPPAKEEIVTREAV